MNLWRGTILNKTLRSTVTCLVRGLSADLTAGEQKITSVLKKKFPSANSITVQDISGGCGAMYEIHVESDDFQGKRTVMQHRMVNQALEEEIKEMHGLRIHTSVPKS